jgi:hypothetical protein
MFSSLQRNSASHHIFPHKKYYSNAIHTPLFTLFHPSKWSLTTTVNRLSSFLKGKGKGVVASHNCGWSRPSMADAYGVPSFSFPRVCVAAMAPRGLWPPPAEMEMTVRWHIAI